MSDYIQAHQKAQELQKEYERRAAELDPLRWKLIQARALADREWQKLRDGTLSNGDR